MNDVVRSSDSAPVSFDNLYSTQYSAEGNQYFTAPDSESLDLSSSATLSYWFKRPTGGQVSVSKWDAGTNQRSFVLQVFTDGKIYWNVSGDGIAHTYLMSDGTVSDTGWNHLAATFDGASMKVYLNGSLMTGTLVGTVPASIYQSNQPVTNTYSGSNFNEGSLDDVRLYDVALSASEIASLADGMCSVESEGSSSSSSSSSSTSSSSSSVSSGGGDEGGGGGEVFGLSTPNARGRNGARRGWQTNILGSLISRFGGDGEAGDVPPGGYGGPGEETFTDEEGTVICRMREALPENVTKAVRMWVAEHLAGKMPHSIEAIYEELRTGSICPLAVVRSTVEAKPVAFRVDAAGYPVSSNETWNKCVRGTATLEDIRNNPDRDQDGYGYSCSRYHTSSLWKHPDLGVLFMMNGKKGITVPQGYAITQDVTVTQN